MIKWNFGIEQRENEINLSEMCENSQNDLKIYVTDNFPIVLILFTEINMTNILIVRSFVISETLSLSSVPVASLGKHTSVYWITRAGRQETKRKFLKSSDIHLSG